MNYLGIYSFGKFLFRKLWLFLDRSDDYIMSEKYEVLAMYFGIIIFGVLILILLKNAIIWWYKEDGKK